jgi:hypothetical protein
LAVGSTFENIRNLLKAAWGICKRWIEFAPEKSELLHFSRAHADYELLLRFGAVTMRPIIDARFLEVWLNNRLSWKAHLAKIKRKIATQMLAFSKLAA